jgi:hypothetical protein
MKPVLLFVRRVVSFACTAALLFGGLYIIFIEVVYGRYIVGRLVAAAGFMIVLGGFWLFEDFIKPIFRRSTSPLRGSTPARADRLRRSVRHEHPSRSSTGIRGLPRRTFLAVAHAARPARLAELTFEGNIPVSEPRGGSEAAVQKGQQRGLRVD